MGKPTILNAVVMAQEFEWFFEDDKMGMCSDVASLELIDEAWNYLRGKQTAEEWLENQLEFIFGFDGIKDFKKALKRYNKRLKVLYPEAPNMDFTPIKSTPKEKKR